MTVYVGLAKGYVSRAASKNRYIAIRLKCMISINSVKFFEAIKQDNFFYLHSMNYVSFCGPNLVKITIWT